MTTNSYRYLITDLYMPSGTSNPILAELPFTNVDFTQQLNGIGSFQGTLLLSGMDNAKLNTINQTIPMKKSLFVDHNGSIIWSGIITSREYDSDSQSLYITAQEYEYYLQKRRINKFTGSAYYSSSTGGLVYPSSPAVDAGTVLYDIVNNMQVNNTGVHKTHTNIGIVCDLFTTGSYVTRTYYDFELKSVYQALKDLSQGSFFDFKIIGQYDAYNNIVLSLKVGAPAVPNSPLNRVYNASTPSQAFVFQLPGNLVGYKYTEDGTTVGNYVYGLGYGANANKLIYTAYDASKITGSATWPLLEENLNFIDIKDTATLGVVTSGITSGISYPPTTIQVILPPWADPNLGGYGVGYTYSIGDQIRLVIKDDFFPSGLDVTNYRITEINVTPGSNGTDRVTITLMLPYATISPA